MGLSSPLATQAFFATLPLDTQDVEGANSIIKKIHTLAPNVKLPLMSARVQIKKTLGDRVLHGSRDARRDAIAYAVESHSSALKMVRTVSDRFQPIDFRDSCDDLLPLQDGGDDTSVEAKNQWPVAVELPTGPSNREAKQRKPRQPRQPPPTGIEAVHACATRMAALLQAAVPGTGLSCGSKLCFTFRVTLAYIYSEICAFYVRSSCYAVFSNKHWGCKVVKVLS